MGENHGWHAREAMTRTVVRVTPETRVRDAQREAAQGGAQYLLVFDGGSLVGTACLCAIQDAPAETLVADRMKRVVGEIPAGAPVGEAAAIMLARSLSCLAVVEGGAFVGVLTRDDLRRAGVPEEALNRRRCAACGSSEHVRADPRGGQTRFCSDCIGRASGVDGQEDLGGD